MPCGSVVASGKGVLSQAGYAQSDPIFQESHMPGGGGRGKGRGRGPSGFSTKAFTGADANLSGASLHGNRAELNSSGSTFRRTGAAPPVGGAAAPSGAPIRCSHCTEENTTESAMCHHCMDTADRYSPRRKRARAARRKRVADASSDDDDDDSESSTDDDEGDDGGFAASAAYAGAYIAYPVGHRLAGSAPEEFGPELQFCSSKAAGRLLVGVVYRYEPSSKCVAYECA